MYSIKNTKMRAPVSVQIRNPDGVVTKTVKRKLVSLHGYDYLMKDGEYIPVYFDRDTLDNYVILG